MKKMIFFCISTFLFATIAIAQPSTEKQLRHVVLFKFKETATPANTKMIEDAFGKLPAQIKFIKGYEWGINNSPEKLNDGLTHCFIVTFTSEKDRNKYLIHPAHKVFVKLLGPYLQKAVVIDYWAK